MPVERAAGGTSLVDVLDRVLDKGIVIDAWVRVSLVGIDGPVLSVRGLDCLDGTPLIDLKPDRCQFTPLAPPTPGDAAIG